MAEKILIGQKDRRATVVLAASDITVVKEDSV